MAALQTLIKRTTYERKQYLDKGYTQARFTQELKYEAIAFMNKTRTAPCKLARQLGVRKFTVQEWARKFRNKELRKGETSCCSSRFPKPRYPKM